MGPKIEYLVDKPQPMTGFIELKIKETLPKVGYEQVSIGRGHTFDQEVKMGVQGEVVLGELDKKLNGS